MNHAEMIAAIKSITQMIGRYRQLVRVERGPQEQEELIDELRSLEQVVIRWRERLDGVFGTTSYPKRPFLGHEELQGISDLRKDGKYEQALTILRVAIPSPAVAYSMRVTLSAIARKAAKEEEWAYVRYYLTQYLKYADEVREVCIQTSKQEPDDLTDRDKALLEKATKLSPPMSVGLGGDAK